MAALTKDRNPLKIRNLIPVSRFYKLGVSKTFNGSLVMLLSTGYAARAAASASNKGGVGWSVGAVDNSGGSAGDKTVEVAEGEIFCNATSIAIGDVGSKMYSPDDNTIDETQGSNEPLVGSLADYVSATEGWLLTHAETGLL